MKTAPFNKASFSGSSYSEHARFWEQMLTTLEEPFRLVSGLARLPNAGLPWRRAERIPAASVQEAVHKIAGSDPADAFVVVASAVTFLLSGYTAARRVLVKTPLLKRAEGESTSTAPVLLSHTIHPGETIHDLVLRCRETLARSYQYQNFPLSAVGMADDLAEQYTNVALYDPALHESVPEQKADTDLILSVEWHGSSFALVATYQAAAFGEAFVHAFLENLEFVLSQYDNVSLPLQEAGYLSPGQSAQVLDWSRGEDVEWPVHTLVELFEQQAQSQPLATALVFEGQSYSYQQLEGQANQLAAYLQAELEMQPGQVVGLLLEKSPRLVVAILSVLKAGAAYLPIDPAYPLDRIEYLCADASPQLLLIDSGQMGLVDHFQGTVFVMDLQLEDILGQRAPAGRLPARPLPQDLAYLIYTSGSTGKPKGVQVSHAAIANTLQWRHRYYQFSNAQVHLQLFSFSFDASLEDVFSCLISGGTLVMPPLGMRTAVAELAALIARYQVNHLLTIPSFYRLLLRQASQLTSLQTVCLAGEALHADLVQKHCQLLAATRLYNEYGPTENAVCSTVALVTDAGQVTIGRPIDNCRLYVLDEQLRLLPAGVSGELCLSGAGLAQGYWQREELTKEKFTDNPYGAGRLYRTGDVGCWDHQGQVHYLGRKDGQVKVRGYRIELAEIEMAIRALPGVEDCLVTARQLPDNTQLVAYLVCKQNLDPAAARASLGEWLPDYMIPAYFVALTHLPLTPSGKLDRAALPDPEAFLTQAGAGPAPAAPAGQKVVEMNSFEAEVAAWWWEVLGYQIADRNANFFQVGGDSLKVILLHEIINQHYPGYVIIPELFDNADIQSQANLISSRYQPKPSAGFNVTKF